MKELRASDVLISTPHMKFPHKLIEKIKFHRVVLDESHLLAHSSSAVGSFSSKFGHLMT